MSPSRCRSDSGALGWVRIPHGAARVDTLRAMRPAPDGPRSPEPRGGKQPYLIALAFTLALPIVIAVIVWAVLPHSVSSGRCEGIGFGCVPSPATTFVLWALVVGLPAMLMVSAATCGAIAWRRSRRGRR